MSDKPETLSDAVFINKLPPGKWSMVQFGEGIVFINPDSRPRILRNGKLEIEEVIDQPPPLD